MSLNGLGTSFGKSLSTLRKKAMSENLIDSDVGPVVADLRSIPLMFVHSSVDDMRLSMAAFRVLFHLSRRAGKAEAWPGMKSMADVCEMGVGSVCRAVKELQGRGLIRVTKRGSQSNIYVITGPDSWKNPDGTAFDCRSNREQRIPLGNGSVPIWNSTVPIGKQRISNEEYPMKECIAPSPSAPATNVNGSAGAIEKKPRSYQRQAESFEDLKRFVTQKLGLTDNDACWLWERWEGNGWTNGGRKMVSWKMTASTWKRSGYFPSQKSLSFGFKR
jgi:hypothetical protein